VSDAACCTSYAAKAESARYESDNEKDQSPIEHGCLLCLICKTQQLAKVSKNKSLTKPQSAMPSSPCKQCDQPLVEIDHWGERLTGCPKCNRWQASTGEWCRLAPDDIVPLRTIKGLKAEADKAG
jgi:hypothetical protein